MALTSVTVKDGVVEGGNVLVEVTVAGGSVSLVVPKAELDALTTPALKVAKVLEYLQKKVYLPIPVVKVTVPLAGAVTVDLSIPPVVLP